MIFNNLFLQQSQHFRAVEVNGEGCAELRFNDYFWVLYIHFDWMEICQIFGRFK